MVAPCHLGECSGFQDLESHPIRKTCKMWCFKNPGPTATCSGLGFRVPQETELCNHVPEKPLFCMVQTGIGLGGPIEMKLCETFMAL